MGFVAVIALILLMPTFLVLAPAGAAPESSSISTPAASLPSASTVTPLSSYRDIGAANPSMSVLVSVQIPFRNLDLLSSVVKETSDPSSPEYRHFLNFSQVSEEFLPTQDQYDSVLNYLTASGFSVVLSELNSMLVVRGTAAQVNQYLGQSVQLYTNGTYSYYQTTGASTLAGAYSYGGNATGLFIRPDFKSGAASGATPDQNVTFTEGAQATTLLRTVYNSTGLLAKGIDGKGYTVGLLDFYGDPQVSSDLALYDGTYGIPAPPNFSIDPIGPYNPNLGNPLGWDGEIDLDVQVSHAMAPGANIVLYPANGELALSVAVAAIVQAGQANVVSQSFGIPEWEFYEIGPLSYLFNLVFADDYYQIGSAMGMTFTSSTGDAGGSGYSAGPEGGVEYPGSSPYVTALGGTATYVSTDAAGQITFNQTAWSNIGFVPYFENLGGSGGGVSVLEPTPWYQSSLPVPASYPDGRMDPDLSLDASGTPGTYIIYQGAPTDVGGTSEASPLFAGLLTLVMGSSRGSLGLINPSLYSIASNAKEYQEAFNPITFGYTIPWTAKYGYNLATGWGAPNVGGLAQLLSSPSPSKSLEISVGVVNPTKQNFTEFFPGQTIDVVAQVASPSGLSVSTGTFSASIQTLAGTTAPVSLTYSATQKGWIGSIRVADEAGIAYVDVSGTSGGASGSGYSSTFLGYLASYVQPISPYPWTFLPGLEVAIFVSDLQGNPPPFNTTGISFSSYSILTNKYSLEATASLNYSDVSEYFIANLAANFTNGPMTLDTTGPVVGYLPFMNGISLEGTAVYPQLVAEPGSVAPGQSVTIIATVTGPENIDLTTSLATGDSIGASIAAGANVTATLVSPNGVVIETVQLPEATCLQALKLCDSGATNINGNLPIPASASPGLYTVLLNAGYNDETTGFNYGGEYFGQIYVAPGESTPTITMSPGLLFEGENATIVANIQYPSGQEVTHGLYTAIIYPATSQTEYSTLDHETYSQFGLIQMTYDPALNAWTANATMPSPYDSALVASTNGNAEYYGGPYDVYVSGLSADGVPTNSSVFAQQQFFIEPYVYTANSVFTSLPQTARVAFSNATIEAGLTPLVLSDDYFVGNNTISGSDVTIVSSTINGTLKIDGGQTTLSGVTGGDVVASTASVVLEHSEVDSLDLGVGTTASLDSASSASSITPALPVVIISNPIANQSYTGTLKAQVSVRGTGVAEVDFVLDGKPLAPLQGAATSGTVTYPIDTASLPDGTHTLTVTAVQSDLLASSASVSFTTDNQLSTVTSNLSTASMTITSLSGSLNSANSNIATLQKNLSSANHMITDLTYIAAVAVLLALVGIGLGIYAVRGGKAPWKY